MKRRFSILLAACLIMISFVTPVHAATKTYTSSGKSFTNSWELTGSGSNWLIKYGYNTAWINEDYTHTYHSSYHHVASVSNSKGAFSDEDKAGNWAGIEVTHSGNYVTYSITY